VTVIFSVIANVNKDLFGSIALEVHGDRPTIRSFRIISRKHLRANKSTVSAITARSFLLGCLVGDSMKNLNFALAISFRPLRFHQYPIEHGSSDVTQPSHSTATDSIRYPSAMKENKPVENALATIGAVMWTVQIIPQIFKSYRSKSTLGLSASLMACVNN